MLSIFITPTSTKSVSSKTLDNHHYQDDKELRSPRMEPEFLLLRTVSMSDQSTRPSACTQEKLRSHVYRQICLMIHRTTYQMSPLTPGCPSRRLPRRIGTRQAPPQTWSSSKAYHTVHSISHIADLSRQIWSCLKYYLLRVDRYDVISLRGDHQEQTHHLWSVCQHKRGVFADLKIYVSPNHVL